AGDEQRRHQQDQRAIQPLPLKPAHLSLTPRTGAISGDIMAAPRRMPVSFSTSSDIRADRTAFRTVIPGLDPGIHAFAYRVDGRSSPAMTKGAAGSDEGGMTSKGGLTKEQLKAAVCEAIDRNGNRIIELGETILHHPETGFNEQK